MIQRTACGDEVAGRLERRRLVGGLRMRLGEIAQRSALAQTIHSRDCRLIETTGRGSSLISTSGLA